MPVFYWKNKKATSTFTQWTMCESESYKCFNLRITRFFFLSKCFKECTSTKTVYQQKN